MDNQSIKNSFMNNSLDFSFIEELENKPLLEQLVFINKLPNINITDKYGHNVLLVGLINHKVLVKHILKARFEIDKIYTNLPKEPANFWSAGANSIEKLNREFVSNKQTILFFTAELFHSEYNVTKQIDLLLKAGANINHQDLSGNTVLFKAIENYNIQSFNHYLKYKPDLNLRNKNNESIFDLIKKTKASTLYDEFISQYEKGQLMNEENINLTQNLKKKIKIL